MDVGQKERVTGYLGERSVERFFLMRNVNARVVEFEAFDLLIITEDCDTIKCQVKTTTKDKFSVGSGRSRKVDYKKGAVDVFALVQLSEDGRDRIWFLLPEDVSGSIAISRLSNGTQGVQGWNRVHKTLQNRSGTSSNSKAKKPTKEVTKSAPTKPEQTKLDFVM